MKKLDLSITPLRVSVIIGGLTLIGLNTYFGWGIPYLFTIFTVVLILTIYLTQPKRN